MSSLLVFNRVYRLEIQSVSSPPSPPPPCVNKYTVHTYTVWGGDYGVIVREGASDKYSTAAKYL